MCDPSEQPPVKATVPVESAPIEDVAKPIQTPMDSESTSIPNNAEPTSMTDVPLNVQTVTTMHLPDHILKVDTNDNWSTTTTLKKKSCTLPDGQTIRIEDIPGVRRFGKNPAKVHMFVYFDSEEAMALAAPLLRQRQYRGQQWTADACAPEEANRALGLDKRPQKRPAEESTEGTPAAKKPKTLEETVTCYAHLEYRAQLALKHRHFCRTLKAMTANAAKTWADFRRNLRPQPPLPTWITNALQLRGFCCEAPPVIPSPPAGVMGYRNNTSFTCGYDESGRDAVGFLLGQYKEGQVAVAAPYATRHISDLSKHYCAVFQAFVDGALGRGLRCYDKCNHQGFWRRLIVRETVTRDVMLLVQHKAMPEGSPVSLEDLYKELIAHFLNAAPTPHLETDRAHALKSIHAQEYDGVSNAAPPNVPYQLIHGEAFILETCLGLQFRVRPLSFFQVNTLANEELIRTIEALGGIDAETLVLDLCCGTGTIGISLAPRCKEVFGVDMVADAITDARDNCTLNGIKNAEYFCDKIESVAVTSRLKGAIARFPPGKVVAICDPPRGGLHPKFLQWLRGADNIQRMVYVSCEQNSLIRDTVPLTKPKSNAYQGEPFKPVSARAIDLFPHTDLCEVVVLWERTSPEEAENAVSDPVLDPEPEVLEAADPTAHEDDAPNGSMD
jgi:tRNA (uracil-5-)-methyltransferase